MNPTRIAKLLRERAAIDMELAEAFEEEERKAPRKRPTPEPTMQPSQEAVDKMRRTLRRKGVAA